MSVQVRGLHYATQADDSCLGAHWGRISHRGRSVHALGYRIQVVIE
jgi:hypothetical protein